jgi:uncharacterized repeat protein (TIGR03803 family)
MFNAHCMLKLIGRRWLLLAIVLALLAVVIQPAQAQTETVLYNFCSLSGCTDGSEPSSGLVFDKKGNLYGETWFASNPDCYGCGTVFELAPNGTEKVLYTFAGASGDGIGPAGDLTFDKKGNLYGTTWTGGAYGYGTVFQVTAAGKENVLYSFADGADGRPCGGVILDNAGNLYGTSGCTKWDVPSQGNGGTVFQLTPAGALNVLYAFGTASGDGTNPAAGVVRDTKGNLYGTAEQNGAYGCGTVFEVTPAGTEIVLHTFTGGADGCLPLAGLVRKGSNLYGTAAAGGTKGWGTVFRVTTKGKFTVLYSFCALSGCADGTEPEAALILDKQGNLYGTTAGGGDVNCQSGYGCGTVFKLTPAGALTVLHSFSGSPSDGTSPLAGLVLDKNGNLYGTTFLGGTNGAGTVFKVTP